MHAIIVGYSVFVSGGGSRVDSGLFRHASIAGSYDRDDCAAVEDDIAFFACDGCVPGFVGVVALDAACGH